MGFSLIAGSGVLGFEALSRGAQQVDLVDQSSRVLAALAASKQMLQADAATIHRSDALAHLTALPRGKAGTETRPDGDQRYDLVFVDPPFTSPLAAQVLERLLEYQLLATDALVYLETPKQAPDVWNPRDWEVFRDKAFGDSRALLLLPNDRASSPPNTC